MTDASSMNNDLIFTTATATTASFPPLMPSTPDPLPGEAFGSMVLIYGEASYFGDEESLLGWRGQRPSVVILEDEWEGWFFDLSDAEDEKDFERRLTNLQGYIGLLTSLDELTEHGKWSLQEALDQLARAEEIRQELQEDWEQAQQAAIQCNGYLNYTTGTVDHYAGRICPIHGAGFPF